MIIENAPILGNIPPGQFAHYNKSFQEKILQGLLTDTRWGAQMIEVMRPDFFELEYLTFLCDKYFSYFNRYKAFPTQQLLITIVKDGLSNDSDAL